MLTTTSGADADELRSRLAGEVIAPGDPTWDTARQAWNLAADQHPVLVAFPEDADDVVAVVHFAHEAGLRIAPQGTGHNATAMGPLHETILLSTSRMRGVEIDVARRRARVQAGTLWLEVTAPASEHGLAPLAGSSPDVGVVGYALGGGVSWLARKHGYAANSVLAIELVTADGRLIRADAEHHDDLFWALRGGGGSFGIVTAMELRLLPLAEVYAGALFWPWERSSEILHAWRAWTAAAPDEVTTAARILRLPPIPDVPEPLRGRDWVTIDGAFLGREAEGRALLRPLRELAPEIDTFAMMPPVGLSRIHGDPETPIPGMSTHAMLGELPAEAVDALIAAAGPGSDTPLLMAELRHLGGALARDVEGGGAVRLDAEYMMFAAGIAAGPELIAALGVALPAFKAALAPWATGREYLNFQESDTDTSVFYRPETFALLREIKGRVDPTDLFRSNHPIPPAVPAGG